MAADAGVDDFDAQVLVFFVKGFLDLGDVAILAAASLGDRVTEEDDTIALFQGFRLGFVGPGDSGRERDKAGEAGEGADAPAVPSLPLRSAESLVSASKRGGLCIGGPAIV